jgi:hypothetical protein
MATKFKYSTIFDIVKVESIAMAEANALYPEFKRETIITLIEKLQWENTRIAELLRVPVSLVESIRLELKKSI